MFGNHTQYTITKSFHPLLRQKSLSTSFSKCNVAYLRKGSTRIISSVSIWSYCFFSGLMHCNIGECQQIPVKTDEFVQILNSNDNHWVIMYAVNYAPGELQVYDSLYRTVSKDIKELVDTHKYDRTGICHAPYGITV